MVLQVVNVSREKLMADVKILEPVKKDVPDDGETLEQVKNTEVIFFWLIP